MFRVWGLSFGVKTFGIYREHGYYVGYVYTCIYICPLGNMEKSMETAMVPFKGREGRGGSLGFGV